MSASSGSGSKGHWREGVPVQGDSGAFAVGVGTTVLTALVLFCVYDLLRVTFQQEIL